MNLCQKKGSEGSAVEQERFSITVSTDAKRSTGIGRGSVGIKLE